MSALASLLATPLPATPLPATPLAAGGSGGSKSPVAFLIVGIVLVALGGLQASNPRLLWRLNKWQYKNPEANEPSKAGFVVWRVAGAIAAVVGVALVIVAITRF